MIQRDRKYLLLNTWFFLFLLPIEQRGQGASNILDRPVIRTKEGLGKGFTPIELRVQARAHVFIRSPLVLRTKEGWRGKGFTPLRVQARAHVFIPSPLVLRSKEGWRGKGFTPR